MSLSWRRRLTVLAGPLSVTLSALGRGWGATVQSVDEQPCGAAGAPGDWQPAIAALDAALQETRSGAAATVLLSNAFCRYRVVPWLPDVGDGPERAAYVRHCFQRVHGERVGTWEIRAGHEAWGAPFLASAVDRELVAAVRETARRHGVSVVSIQPWLMWAFNRWRRRIRERDFCLALLENGCVCLAVAGGGRWLSVRSTPLAGTGDPRSAITVLIERELRRAALDPAQTAVYVHAAGPVVPDAASDRLPRWVALVQRRAERGARGDVAAVAASL